MDMRKIALIICLFLCTVNCVFASTVKFAQISDLHYRSDAIKNDDNPKIKYYALPILDDVSKKINDEDGISFVLITGDAVDKSRIKDSEFIYKYFNKKFEMPWYYCLGNHDISIRHVNRHNQIKLLDKYNTRTAIKDKSYYSFQPQKDMTFICLDANIQSHKTSTGHISKTQLNFLDRTIANSGEDIIVIFMHHTLIKSIKSKTHNISNIAEIENILKKYDKPILVLGGHKHACKIEQDKNIIKVSSPSLISYPIAYRVITIDNYSDKTVFKFEYRETSKNNLQSLAKSKADNPEILKGTKNDRERIIIIPR